MEIILKKEVANLGHADDIVKVKAVTLLTILFLRDMQSSLLSLQRSSMPRQFAREHTRRLNS